MAKRGLKNVPVTDLEAEIQRRDREAEKLAAKRDRLLEQVGEIEAELDKLGYAADGPSANGRRGRGAGKRRGSTAGMGRKRPKNDMNLVEALQKVLKNKTMGVAEAADAVQKLGYKSSAANFRTIVNQTLIKHPKAFKKVARGQYTAK